MAGQQTPYLGSKISLISKSEIRYEGILYTVDTNESTIALANVKSFGTENRPTDRPVAARDDIYEFIIFKATDIKDLSVCETPQQMPQLPGGLPYDPAIVQVSQGASHEMRNPNTGSRSVTPSLSQPLSPATDQIGHMGGGMAGVDQSRAPGAGRPPPRRGGGIGRGSGMSTGSHASGYGSPLDTSMERDNQLQQHSGMMTFADREEQHHGSAGFGRVEYRRSIPQRDDTAPRYQSLNKFSGRGGNYSSGVGPRHGGSRGAFSRPTDSFSGEREHNDHDDIGFRSYSQALRRGPGESGFGRGLGRGGGAFAREDDRFSGGYRGNRGIFDNGGMRAGGMGYRYGFGGLNGGGGGGWGNFRGGNSYYRGGSRGSGGPRGGITLKIPTEDFDFEQSQKKFEETLKETGEEIDKLKITNGDSGEDGKHDEEPGNDSQGNESDCPGEDPATYYNKDSSFFDSISCEATEKEEGMAERRAGNFTRRHERQLNTETFGTSSVHRGFRGGFRRGMNGMRWGRGGGRGYGSVYRRDDGAFPTRIRSS